MFIVWGKKRVSKKLGYVANFCPMCRQVRAFKFYRIGLAGHVYYISAGEGELVGYNRECTVCHAKVFSKEHPYEAYARRVSTLEALIAETFPKLQAVWGARLTLEQDLKFNPMSLNDADREYLVREPFYVLGNSHEAKLQNARIDARGAASLLGAFVVLIALLAISEKWEPAWELGGKAAAFILAIATVVWGFWNAKKRYVLKYVLPQLTATLRPLRPRQHELAAAAKALQVDGLSLGKLLNQADVLPQVYAGANSTQAAATAGATATA